MILESGNWYGWQMLPGYFGGPYFSPIRISRVQVLDDGRVWDVKFLNALYAAGVQNTRQRLRLLANEAEYTIVRIEGGQDRSAVISPMSSGWLDSCCPRVLHEIEATPLHGSLSDSLDVLFGRP